MRITQLHVTVGRTINLGNYNSLKIEQGVTVDLEDGDSIEDARAAAFDEIKHGLIEREVQSEVQNRQGLGRGNDLMKFRDVFNYHPKTGVLTWKIAPKSRAKIGDVAGTKTRAGYTQVTFKGQTTMAHRIAWEIYYGEEPQGFIDHKDGNKSNNAIWNLRIASKQQNAQNAPVQTNSHTGVKGVHWCKDQNKWRATIKHNGKTIHLGRFSCMTDAKQAYDSKAKELHGEFFR